MRLVTVVLAVLLSAAGNPFAEKTWEAVQPIMETTQDGIRITQKTTPLNIDGYFQVDLSVTVADELIELQDAEGNAYELLSPLAVLPSPHRLSTREAKEICGKLKFRLCEDVYFVWKEQVKAETEGKELIWDVYSQMQEEGHANLVFWIRVDEDKQGHNDFQGNIYQMQSAFTYAVSREDDVIRLQKLILQAPKIRNLSKIKQS